jgi:hypothetical protein
VEILTEEEAEGAVEGAEAEADALSIWISFHRYP